MNLFALAAASIALASLATPASAAPSSTERRMIAAVDAEQARTLALLEKLVNQNSGSLNIPGVTAVGRLLARLGLTPQKPLQRAYQRDPQAIERWQRETYPGIAAAARQSGADIYFWDESGFRADTVHSKTWARKGKTPVVQRPGRRQSISAASAVNAKGGFWFATYEGALNAELFVQLLKKMMRGRSKPVHLVVDGLPAHKRADVREYIASTKGKLCMHRACPDFCVRGIA